MASSSSSSSSSSSLVDSLFQQSLADLIKSLRSTPPSAEASFLSSSLASIRRELSSPDPETKSVALQKLTYLSSLHFLPTSSPPPWSHFPAVSLLPSPLLPHKRSAHLFLSLFLRPSSTDLLPLSTHQLHKDLTSPSELLTSLALSSLASAASPDLSRHLAPDLVPILSPAARPKTRSRATAAALSVLALSPDSVPLIFPRLVDNLSDPLTVSAAVNVFCELSAADPRSHLPLAPDFFKILSGSNNNWILIKIVKIFSRLAPLEPRLAKRVADPICELIARSNAKSLVYECILAVFTSFRDCDRAVRVAADKLKDEFLSSDDDPNLRYLGLRALSVLGNNGHPWAVEANREVVVRSLMDPDRNIRHEALNLVMGIVLESNVVEITLLLVGYALRSDPEFANEIIDAILRVCGRNYYEMVEDFDWYVNVLGDLARNPHCWKGEEIERQLVDIGLRVRDARPELVRVARDLLIDPAFLGNHFLDRVLSAAAWVSGEYVGFSKNPMELLEALLQPRTSLLSPSARAVYVQAVLKVLVFYLDSYIEQTGTNANGDDSENNNGVESEDGASTSQQPESRKPFTHESTVYILNLVEKSIGPLSECHEVEVQERARNVLVLIYMLKQSRDWGKDGEGLSNDSRIHEIVKRMKGVFSEELGPVSVHAQQKVTVPKGLILKENLANLATILGEDDIVPTSSTLFTHGSHHRRDIEEESEPGTESTSLLAEHRKRHGLYYLAPEKDGAELNDYPKANDPLLSVSQGGDAVDELLKLTEKSLIPRKAKATKPRPVVVKLDEGDSIPTSSKPVSESNDEILSGAIREVLLGSEGSKPTSSQKVASDKSSRRKSKDVLVISDTISQPKENLGEIEQGSSSSRRSKHRRHGKGRHRSHHEKEDKEGTSHTSRQSDRHHHGKHKHRQRADVPLAVVPQAQVIPDFLL